MSKPKQYYLVHIPTGERVVATFQTGYFTTSRFSRFSIYFHNDTLSFWLEKNFNNYADSFICNRIVFTSFSKSQISAFFLNKSFYEHIEADIDSFDTDGTADYAGEPLYEDFWTFNFKQQFIIIPTEANNEIRNSLS